MISGDRHVSRRGLRGIAPLPWRRESVLLTAGRGLRRRLPPLPARLCVCVTRGSAGARGGTASDGAWGACDCQITTSSLSCGPAAAYLRQIDRSVRRLMLSPSSGDASRLAALIANHARHIVNRIRICRLHACLLLIRYLALIIRPASRFQTTDLYNDLTLSVTRPSVPRASPRSAGHG